MGAGIPVVSKPFFLPKGNLVDVICEDKGGKIPQSNN